MQENRFANTHVPSATTKQIGPSLATVSLIIGYQTAVVKGQSFLLLSASASFNSRVESVQENYLLIASWSES